MEVILQEEVPALGIEGDVVQVAPGFANNYLIPKGIAVLATPGNLKQLEQKRVGIERRHGADRAAAKELAGKVDGKSITISAKAGEEGKLYGSVTVKDIAAVIQEEFGVEVDRRRIISDPIKEAGDATVRIRFHADVEATLGIKVIAELAEGAAETAKTAEIGGAEPEEAPSDSSDDTGSE